MICVPFFLLALHANMAAQQVTVGDPIQNNGLSFVDATSHTSSTVVHVGDTVQWTWGADPMKHSTTSGTCVGAVCQTTPFWDSGESFKPNTFSRIFNNPGLFPYFCTVHDSAMTGTVRALPTPATFASGTPVTVGAQPSAVAVGDFNGDGKLDLAVANHGSNSITILLGNGSGMFTTASGSPITGGMLSSPISIAVADFNQDGKMDLAVANSGNSSITILLGHGDGTFTAGTPIILASPVLAVAAADFDGDGNQDLAVTINPASSPTQNNVAILLGDGMGGFAVPAFFSTGGSVPNSLVAFDFNHDNKPDLAVTNAASSNLSVFLNMSSPGSVSFATATNITTGISPHGITAGIFNDGQGNPTPGIAVANEGGNNNSVSVFLEDTMGDFVAASGSPFPVGRAPMAVVTGDFNGDGYLDLAAINTGDNSVTTLMNDAAGSFTSFTTISPISSPQAIVAGDFNGDNKPDLAVVNFLPDSVSILLNATTFPPATPGPATHFGIAVQSNGPLSPEGNPTTTAGLPVQITVTAYDAYQQVASGYTGTVNFHSSDGQAALPGDYTFTGTGGGHDNGVHTFTITLKTAGIQTIDLHDTGNPLINGRSDDILVSQAAASTFAVSAPASVSAGNPFNFSVTAMDAYGNLATNYGGTVKFSSSDTNGCVVLPGQSILNGGVGVFSAKLITAGTQTLIATDSVNGTITGNTHITVNSDTLHLDIVPSLTNVVVGQPISITVSERDTCENLQTSYSGTVHFTSTDPTPATLPADYTFTVGMNADNGIHKIGRA